MRKRDNMRADAQAGNRPFTPGGGRATLIQRRVRGSIDHRRKGSKTRPRLVNNAQLIADKTECDGIVQG